MKLSAILTGIFLLFASVSVVLPDMAEAARMGGGRSFGSKPSMNRTAPAPSQSMTQSGAQQGQKQAAAQAAKPGLFGGMGGLFGGLLAGTLLGSLLAGTGFLAVGFWISCCLVCWPFWPSSCFPASAVGRNPLRLVRAMRRWAV